jgi:hypothetical protein
MDDRVSIPGRGNDGIFLLRHLFQTCFGARQVSYPMGTWGSFRGGKADHRIPSSAEVKNAWNYTPTPPICFYDVVIN